MKWRKGLVLCAIVLMTSVIAAACGNTGNNGNAGAANEANTNANANSGDKEQNAQTEEEATTRKVTHLMGETEIPVNPQRIVADQYIGHLLALGIKPVGARGDLMKSPFLKELTEGIADSGSPMSLEAVLDLKPDLIIVQNGDNYEQLSKIAPTIVYEYGKLNSIEQLKLFGEILGKQKEADAWVTSFEQKAASYREQLANVVGKDETVSIIELWAQGPFVFGNNWGRGGYSLYNSLQLSAPEIVKQEILDKEQYRNISMEVLPEYAGDYIFLTVYAADGGDKKSAEIQSSEIWKSLPAYKNNRIITLNIDEMAAGDPISMMKQMDIQVESLLALKK
jgi:iron complex transport system substrate-binding protein